MTYEEKVEIAEAIAEDLICKDIDQLTYKEKKDVIERVVMSNL